MLSPWVSLPEIDLHMAARAGTSEAICKVLETTGDTLQESSNVTVDLGISRQGRMGFGVIPAVGKKMDMGDLFSKVQPRILVIFCMKHPICLGGT